MTREDRMKELKDLKFVPHWVSHLGCLEGCLKYLGINVSTPWLYGATGHAFVINIAKDVCPSGPTAWRTHMLFELARNIGARIDGLFVPKEDKDFSKKLEAAWRFMRESIDAGQPCYGWQIGDIADFYVIYGYDDIGYYYKGYFKEDGDGPKPWDKIGQMFLEMFSVRRVDPADNVTTVKQAFQNVLKHSKNPKDWIFHPNYKSGIEGFNAWIEALESGTAVTFGNAYNAVVWAECRKFGVDFLLETSNRLGEKTMPLFKVAIEHYNISAKRLAKVSELYPFSKDLTMDPVRVDDKSRKAAETLRAARDAEADGLQVLAKIVDCL